MAEFTAHAQWRRWLTEAGLVCMGTAAFLTAGCAGTTRDGSMAAAGTASTRAPSRHVATTTRPGRTTLSDQSPSSQQIAAQRRAAGNRGVPATPHHYGESGRAAIAQRPAAPRPQATPPASRQAAAPAVAATAPPPVIRRPSKSVAAKTASRPVITPAGAPAPAAKRAVAQASARKASDSPRTRKPVITPAGSTRTAAQAAPQLEFERERADRLMARAHRMLENDFREEALRLALVAEQLERSGQARYQRGEERPSALVARIRAAEGDRLIADRAHGEQSTAARESPAAAPEPKRTYRNRSRPAAPVSIGGGSREIELTEIIAGWQPAAGSDSGAAHGSICRFTGAAPHVESETACTADTERELAAAGGEDPGIDAEEGTTGDASHVDTEVGGPLLTAAISDSSSGPVLAAAESQHLAHAPLLQSPGDDTGTGAAEPAEMPIDDPADAEPAATPTVARLRLNLVSLAGLVIGVAGLVGLAIWRKRHQQHYAGAGGNS